MTGNLWLNQFHIQGTSLGSNERNLFNSPETFTKLKTIKNEAPDRPVRIAFIGQSIYFQQASIEREFYDANCIFIDYTKDADPTVSINEIRNFDPSITIVFRPDMCRDIEVALKGRFNIGYFTEPLPTEVHGDSADLRRRLDALIESKLSDSQTYSMYVAYNPLIGHTLEQYFPIWQYVPIPVADTLFQLGNQQDELIDVSRGLFVGRVTPYRNKFLEPLKHSYSWTVLDNAYLVDLRPYSLALNLHNDTYPNFENRVLLHMALGQLVITERLEPSYDLGNGVTHIEFSGVSELEELIELLKLDSISFEGIRANGFAIAKNYSATKIWSRIFDDLATAFL